TTYARYAASAMETIANFQARSSGSWTKRTRSSGCRCGASHEGAGSSMMSHLRARAHGAAHDERDDEDRRAGERDGGARGDVHDVACVQARDDADHREDDAQDE